MIKSTITTKIMLVATALLCMAMATASANVSVSGAFANHMVLQRNKPVPVFGTASPGETVTVKFNGQQVSTTANSAGNWLVMLTAMSANKTAQNLTITGNNTVTISDVLIGDVWICSGQSNMAMSLGSCNRPSDVSSANFPGIRIVWGPWGPSGEPLQTFSGNWSVCSPSTASGFSAVAFYFARKIYQDNGGNIPVGLMVSSVGGTRIEPWLAPEGCTNIPALQSLFNEPPQSSFTSNFALFNGMVHPFGPYAAKGLLWYQGENSENSVLPPDGYYLKMKALQQGYKNIFGPDDFAFYFVQLANYGTLPDSPAPVLSRGGWDADTRLQQANAMSLPHSGMGSAIDIGDSNDMHPTDKLDLGERLALWALKNEYGQSNLVTSGPILRDVTVSGSNVICSFDYVGSGLMVGSKTPYQPTQEVVGGTLTRFSIAGADNNWVTANAVISGNTVVLSGNGITAPKKVAYACWSNPLGCNLYNREGLPASPFYVDDVAAKFTVAATAGSGGSISPAGTTTYLKRHTALYTITPSAGHYIQDVKVDGVSVGSVKYYTFDPLYANHTISATFAETAPTYNVTATSSPGGSISPVGAQTVAQGGSQRFTITPDPGNVLRLSVDGYSVGPRASYTFGDVRSNHTIAATFLCPIDAQSGYGGNISPFGRTLVTSGESKTFTITPMPGFSIANVKVDGVGIGPVTSYTFDNVTVPHTIVASFTGGVSGGVVPQQSQLLFSLLTDSLPSSGAIGSWSTYLPTGKSLSAMGSPTATTIDGRKFEQNSYVDGDGFNFGSYSSPIACSGATAVVVAKPNVSGFSSSWTSLVDVFYDRLVIGIKNGNGKVCVRRNGSIDESATAIPAGQTTILSLVVQPNGNYKVYANGAEMMSNSGTSTMTSLAPNGGFNSIYVGRGVDSWAAFDGNIGDVFVYKTALNDTERQQLEAYLTGRLISNTGPTFSITSSAGTGGAISPAGVVVVGSGSGQLFTVTPSIGYAIDDVKVDNVSVGAVTSYRFTNVTANHTISATFRSIPTVTLTASAGTGGTISPNGSVIINSGGNQTFTITPSTGYAIADVKVDGGSVGAVGTYTFSNATANHTIAATFNALPVAVTGRVTDVTTGAAISGASVYFSASSNPSASPAYTATTDASGDYSQTVPAGTWYVAAKKTGYDLSADKTVTVTAGSTPTADFALSLTPIIGTEVFYKFDETTGTTASEASGSGKVGTLTNGPVWTAGRANNCLSFDGSNDYVAVPNLGDYAAMTISAWVNLDTLGADATGSAIVACDGTDAGDIQLLILKSGGKLRFSLTGNTAVDSDSNYAFTSADFGKWRHVAVVYDSVSKTVKFYINGGLNATRTLTTTRLATLSNGVRVGGWSGGRYFDGKIDEFHIYGRALSASEIASIVNSSPSTKIAEAKKLANGELVTLADKVVIYAPRNASGGRNTNYFYIEESDRSAGLFVQNVSSTKDNLIIDTLVSVSGIMKTITYTGQRYLELSSLPGNGTATVSNALGMTTKSIQENPSAQGLLVRVVGKVVELSPDKDWFTMADGYGVPTIVICETGIPLSGFAVGDTVVVTGAVGRDVIFGDAPESVVYPRSVVKI